ncbi:MAG: TonB family protein / TonB-dependent receptor [bacterium]|nr:TonB family protein / TonB-dependent receptor [bacterium]
MRLRFGHVVVLACLAAPLRARADEPPAAFEPAKLTESVRPEFPPMKPGQIVEVGLLLDVDTEGKVTGITVEQSGGQPFDDAASAAARQFVFTPARAKGRAIPATVPYRARFVAPPAEPKTIVTVRQTALPLIGEVRGRGDRVPQPRVSVIIDDGVPTVLTDERGRFVIEDLTVGEHVVHFRGVDIRAYDETVHTRLNSPIVMSVYVEVKPRYVSHVRGRLVLQDPIEQTLTSDEILHIAGTQGDTLKAVQNLPGIARPPFNGGLIAVWGSPPGDTRVYADGVFIPTLFHFGGVRSTVNASFVQSLTLLPGGYDVEHGRGLGGVVEIETRDPRSDGIHGYAQADLVDASGLLEGGIGKNFSFGAAFRVSWLEFFLPYFLETRTRFEPKYWDYQLKLHFRLSKRDNLDLFFFGSDDGLDVGLVDTTGGPFHEFKQHTFFHRGLVRWSHRFDGGASLSVTPSIGYDVPYGLDVTVGNGTYSHTDGQLSYSLRALYHLPISRELRFDAGLDYEGTRYTLDARQNLGGLYREGDTGDFLGYTAPNPNAAVLTDHMLLYTNHVAPFASLTVSLFHQRLLIMPQLRLETMTFYGSKPQHFTSSSVLPEPRLALRVRASSIVSLQGSVGVFHQPPGLADLSSVFGNPALQPEFAIHYVAGIEVKATPTLHVELQGFYKDLRNLVVRGVLPGDPQLVDGGVGRVYGMEILARQELWRNFFGWVSYTLMRSERRDHPGDPWRPFQYDQTHILTALGSYKFPLGFQLGVRFRYVTGNPITPVTRAYYDVNSYSYVPVYGAPYSSRLPTFHQLDVRIDKTFAFNTWKLTIYLDLQNVYDSTSAEGVIYSFDFRRPQYLNGLPFLPILGVRGEF